MLQQDDKEYRNRQDTVNPRRADERASSITSKIWAIVGSIVIILIVTICLHPITTTMTTTKTTTATTSAIVKTATSIHHTVPLNLTEMLFREGQQKGGKKRFERRTISYRPSRYPNAKCARECSQVGATKWKVGATKWTLASD
jgi:hypothetical protein